MKGEASAASSGRAGEEAACRMLLEDGWSIVARNFRSRFGEIDIVAEKGGVLAFFEVKCWRFPAADDLASALNRRKIQRIIETSKIFLAKYRQYSGKRIRYDVILLTPAGNVVRYEGAFDESL